MRIFDRHTIIFHRPRRPGFTLLEVLVAASVFSIIGMLATSIFVNTSQNRQKITSRNQIYDDAQFILDRLSREIASNTIDYEEYYNRLVLGGAPGMNFGRYAAQFYYNTDPAGDATCANLTKDPKSLIDNQKSCVNTGRNPKSADPTGNDSDANAFFAPGAKPDSNIFCTGFDGTQPKDKDHACVTQLFLINEDGNRKTMIAPENIDSGNQNKPFSFVLSQVVMMPVEITVNTQLTKLSHLFTCAASYTCSQADQTINKLINVPAGINSMKVNYPDPKKDLTSSHALANAYLQDFVPFTPSRVNIKSVKFFISPVEDPHKAFAEKSQNPASFPTVIRQPTVTIVLQVEPISNVKFNTNYPTVTVQTTVTPGLFAEVQSYPPQMEVQ